MLNRTSSSTQLLFFIKRLQRNVPRGRDENRSLPYSVTIPRSKHHTIYMPKSFWIAQNSILSIMKLWNTQWSNTSNGTIHPIDPSIEKSFPNLLPWRKQASTCFGCLLPTKEPPASTTSAMAHTRLYGFSTIFFDLLSSYPTVSYTHLTLPTTPYV